MTRQEQNKIIINAISNKLKDLPNVQQVISSKFDAWFRSLVEAGAESIRPSPQAHQAQQPQEGPPQQEAQ